MQHTKSASPPSLLRRSPRQRLVQVRWEPVPQLTGIRCQVERHLLQLIDHELARALVSAKGAVGELVALADAADDGPHEEVRDVDGDGLREAGEFGCVGADDACVADGVEREDFEASDFL